MQQTQAGILADVPKMSRYLSFSIESHDDIIDALKALIDICNPDESVIGIGKSLVDCLDKNIPGLQTFPALSASGIDIPSTPSALWVWLRGEDGGELFHRSRLIENILAPAFTLTDVVDSFMYDESRDLSGYIDGTENPQDEEAIEAATVKNMGAGFDGGSFVAVQQWLHDFEFFDSMNQHQQDDMFGRHIADNEEFDEAPPSAHVKRAEQESFSPEAFILRRSMPWKDGMSAGLIFVAFGKSHAAYDAILKRMIGMEDGITDALFEFTHPVSGAYFWCPPVINGKLDMSALGIT